MTAVISMILYTCSRMNTEAFSNLLPTERPIDKHKPSGDWTMRFWRIYCLRVKFRRNDAILYCVRFHLWMAEFTIRQMGFSPEQVKRNLRRSVYRHFLCNWSFQRYTLSRNFRRCIANPAIPTVDIIRTPKQSWKPPWLNIWYNTCKAGIAKLCC